MQNEIQNERCYYLKCLRPIHILNPSNVCSVINYENTLGW